MGIISDPKSPVILIIDDSPDERYIYEQFLVGSASQNYQIIGADTGEEGLQLLQEHPCNLILLDFNLPDLDGLELLEILQESNLRVPVVMMTGQGSELIAVQAMKQGASDYLLKQQITPANLQSTVRNVLEQARLQTQLRQSEQRQSLITSIALRIRQTLDLGQILEKTTVEIHRLLECDRVLIYQFASDMGGTIVAESVNPQYPSAFGEQIQDSCFQSGAGEGYLHGKFWATSDIQQAQLTPCHLELLEQFSVRANLVMPILLTSQNLDSQSSRELSPQLWGLLVAHQCSAPRVWTTEEVQLIQLLSIQLAIAIRQAELLTKTQRSLRREQELNALKSQVIGTISHEYRSPLASILASASTLSTHGDNLPKATHDKLLGIIEQKVRHMNSLVEDMLFLNEVEIGQIPLKPVSLNISEFLWEQIEEHKLKAPEYTINLETENTIESFENDPKILAQIFSNLLSNAIKYSVESRRIDVQLKELSSEVIVIIKDYGIGISSEDQKNLFQPFHRGINVGTIPGTGLGLSIVQSCLKMCGGKISYSSQPDRGTKVIVGLPREMGCNTSLTTNLGSCKIT